MLLMYLHAHFIEALKLDVHLPGIVANLFNQIISHISGKRQRISVYIFNDVNSYSITAECISNLPFHFEILPNTISFRCSHRSLADSCLAIWRATFLIDSCADK